MMTKAAKRTALYVRVSTDHQSVENQVRQLKEVAERRGWIVVEVYRDAGVSGAKGRDQRPGLDALLKDASRRKFDVVMAWAIDRLVPLPMFLPMLGGSVLADDGGRVQTTTVKNAQFS